MMALDLTSFDAMDLHEATDQISHLTAWRRLIDDPYSADRIHGDLRLSDVLGRTDAGRLSDGLWAVRAIAALLAIAVGLTRVELAPSLDIERLLDRLREIHCVLLQKGMPRFAVDGADEVIGLSPEQTADARRVLVDEWLQGLSEELNVDLHDAGELVPVQHDLGRGLGHQGVPPGVAQAATSTQEVVA